MKTSQKQKKHGSKYLWDRANQQYPGRWYERRSLITVIAFFCALLFAWFQIWVFHTLFDWRLGVMGMFLVILGETIDIYSTIAVFRLRSQFYRRKLPFSVIESNPHLPEQPTTAELIYGIPTLTAIIVLPFAFIFPSFGIQVMVNKICLVLNNYRMKKRLLSVLQMV